MSAIDRQRAELARSRQGRGIYWILGTLLVLALGIGGGLALRHHFPEYDISREREATGRLVHELGLYALPKYIDDQECLPKTIDELLPYGEIPRRVYYAPFQHHLDQGLDAWGRGLVIRFDADAGRGSLTSLGPDGVESDDDIVEEFSSRVGWCGTITVTANGVPDPRFEPVAEAILQDAIAAAINQEIHGLMQRANLSEFELLGILDCERFFPEGIDSGSNPVKVLFMRHGNWRTISTSYPEFSSDHPPVVEIDVIELPHIEHVLVIAHDRHTVTLKVVDGVWVPLDESQIED